VSIISDFELMDPALVDLGLSACGGACSGAMIITHFNHKLTGRAREY